MPDWVEAQATASEMNKMWHLYKNVLMVRRQK